MTNTAALLIAILAGQAERVKSLDDADWFKIIELAKKMQVVQTLFTYLKLQEVVLPPAVAQAIYDIHLTNAVRNTRILHILEIVLEALVKKGISVVPFKGAWLAESVYRNIALRNMGDIDLWTPKSQIDDAKQVMYSLGYESRSKDSRPQALQDVLGGETQMFKTGSPMIELHWNVFPGEWLRHTGRVNDEEVWRRTLPLKGENIRQLSPEDALIHLCVHLAINHQMSSAGLRSLLDLAELRKKFVIDWAIVAQRARAWHVATATWLVLEMLSELFGDPEKRLPLNELRPSPARIRVLRRFVTPDKVMDGIEISGGPKRFLYLLALVDSPVDALCLILQALFPDRAWLTLRYGLQDAPEWKVWWQRFRHPLSVVLKRQI